jgi:peroxiredoxin
MTVPVGSEAPDFTLTSDANEPVTLSSHRGRPVVLVFYPWDFSPTCQGEMCEYRDNWDLFEEAGGTVYGISRDSRYAHAAWRRELGLKQTLLADVKGDVARLYDCWNEDLGRAERLTVVVDPEGRVVYERQNPASTPRDFREALEAVRTAGKR